MNLVKKAIIDFIKKTIWPISFFIAAYMLISQIFSIILLLIGNTEGVLWWVGLKAIVWITLSILFYHLSKKTGSDPITWIRNIIES